MRVDVGYRMKELHCLLNLRFRIFLIVLIFCLLMFLSVSVTLLSLDFERVKWSSPVAFEV